MYECSEHAIEQLHARERARQRQRQSDSRERARAKGSCDLSIITAIAEVTFHVRVCV